MLLVIEEDMKAIMGLTQKRLAEKNLASVSRGAFVLRIAKEFLSYPDLATGYLRRNKLFLSVSAKEDKPSLFMAREKMKKHINITLKDTGYIYVLQDIRIT